jgi:tetratricopeptide (TPR) repeat protein
MAYMRAQLLGVVVLLAAEAWAAPASSQTVLSEAELVAGHSLGFAAPASALRVPTAEEAFGLDAEMLAFVAPLKDIREPRFRLVSLIKALETHGLFSLDYAEVTRTASATFRERQGNCLSFTMLFVALARAVGLKAVYQSVEVPPTWANDGQVVIASHVNAVVDIGGNRQTTVDFNIRDYRGDQQSRRVSDRYALGLFYTNLGAEALLQGSDAASLVYLREAARAYADIAGLWVNLGVLYARHGYFDHAEAAYLRALKIDDGELSALANLVRVYESLGSPERAAAYRGRVQNYRERNPYYHYATAVRALEQQQLPAALTSIRKALRLKSDEHEFYALRGQVLAALGRARDAQQSFERASEFEAVEYARSQERVRFEGLAP